MKNLLFVVFLGSCVCLNLSPPAKPNFLMVVVDDLRPELQPFLSPDHIIKTPNIAALAKDSMIFTRAYTQQAVCSPSRNSFLSGRRPDTTMTWNFIDSFRKTPPDGKNWTALPQFFKENGYFSAGCGKVYHPGHPKNNDLPYSWSTPYWYAPSAQVGACGDYKPFCNNIEADECVDKKLADYTIANLTSFAKEKKQFFYATGFHRPHVDWVVPKQFYDIYPDPANIPLPTHKTAPTQMPHMAFWADVWFETHGIWNGTKITPTKPAPDYLIGEFRRGYYASVSFMDQQVGRVLETLKNLGLEDNTVVILFGDHGWQLGEHGIWCKRTNFELGTRVPLMVKVPWLTETHGTKSDSLVELLDVYPTLAEIAGLQHKVEKGVQGVSFVPVLHNPRNKTRTIAFSQYPRCKGYDEDPTVETHEGDIFGKVHNGGCINVDKTKFQYMGLTMRTEQYRFTEWYNWNGTALKPQWNAVAGTELYSHIGDDGTNLNKFENENLAYKSEYTKLVKQMRTTLQEKWDTNP